MSQPRGPRQIDVDVVLDWRRPEVRAREAAIAANGAFRSIKMYVSDVKVVGPAASWTMGQLLLGWGYLCIFRRTSYVRYVRIMGNPESESNACAQGNMSSACAILTLERWRKVDPSKIERAKPLAIRIIKGEFHCKQR